MLSLDPLSFGEIFDIPRLQESLHMPILEWRDIKDLKLGREQPPEPLGCWSVWAPYDGDQKWPRRVRITEELQLGEFHALYCPKLFVTSICRPIIHAHNGTRQTIVYGVA